MPTTVHVIKYPADQEFHFSKALNIGLEKTTSPLVAIISPHITIHKIETISIMIEGLLTMGCSAVYAARSNNSVVEEDNSSVPLWTTVFTDNYSGFNALHNTFSIIRRDLWEQHHFAECINSTEDQEWALWHYKHSKLPTATLRNFQYRYENRNENYYKIVREYLMVGYHFYPKFFTATALLKLSLIGVRALLLGDWKTFRANFEIIVAAPLARRLVPRMSCRAENRNSVFSHLW